MKKELVTHFTYNTIESQAVGGTVAIFDLSKGTAKKLYLFVEIESSDKDNASIITALSSQLQHHFYSAPTETVEYAFENALAKANASIKDNLLTKPKNWLTKIHIAAVASTKEEVHISTVGNVRAYLIHQERIIDILGNGTSNTKAQTAQAPNPIKLFSNIVSGSLYQDTAITILNDTVLDYLSEERIRKCIKEYNPQEALAKIEELLSKAPPTKQFAMAILKRMVGTKPVVEMVPETGTPRKKEAPQKESTRPTKKEKPIPEEFEEAYDDTIDTGVEHISDTDPLDMYDEEPEDAESLSYLKPRDGYTMDRNSISAQSILDSIKRTAPIVGQKILTYILAGLSWLLAHIQAGITKAGPAVSNLPGVLKNIWKNRKARDYHFSKIKDTVKEKTQQTTKKVTQASPTQKYILMAVGVLVLIFVGSLVLRARENTIVAVNEDFSDRKNAIEQQLNEAEAALIYNNESRARQVLLDVQHAITSLSQEYPEKVSELESYTSQMTSMQDRSEHKKVFNDLSPFVTIIPAPITEQQTGLVSLAEGVYYYDGVQERIAELDAENALLLSLPLDNQGLAGFQTAAFLNETDIAALSEDTVYFVDTSDETLSKQLFEYNPATAFPFTSYAQNLYTLDPDTRTIIRYRKAGQGFTPAQEWMQETYDFSGMTDIAVDGFIYTLHESGDIHVFLRGAYNKKIAFPVADKPTGTPRLYTTEDSDYFYILDTSKQRIVHMTKTGELIVQYVSPLLAEAQSFVVDPEENNIYVLVHDAIYQIPLEK